MQRKNRYVINIDNGTVNVRTSAHAENPFLFRPIDEETARAINDGGVKAEDVIEAIERIERGKSDFSWKEYDRQRHAAEKLLNVSRREMVPEDTDPDMVQDNDKADEATISLADLGLAGKPKDGGEKPKRTRAEKPRAEKQESDPGVDDFVLGRD